MLLKNKASLKAWCGLAVLGALFAIMLASTLTLAPRNACAGAPPVQPCDPLYMDAMEKRAWLEAQREIAMNQNIIVKPDSVLEYTCFDQFLGMLAQRYTNGYLFSEVACCGVTPDFDILNLLLQQGVWNAVVPYLSVNFEHTFRGGNSGQDIAPPGLDYAPLPLIIDGGYYCDKMVSVWIESQCLNFFNSDHEPDGYDGSPWREDFYDFYWYTLPNTDPRQQPYPACSSPINNAALGIAFNNRQVNYVLNPENTGIGTYPEDIVSSNFARIWPFGGPGGCMPPIATGITVDRVGMAPYPDMFCPNPGCHYTGPAGTCANP